MPLANRGGDDGDARGLSAIDNEAARTAGVRRGGGHGGARGDRFAAESDDAVDDSNAETGQSESDGDDKGTIPLVELSVMPLQICICSWEELERPALRNGDLPTGEAGTDREDRG